MKHRCLRALSLSIATVFACSAHAVPSGDAMPAATPPLGIVTAADPAAPCTIPLREGARLTPRETCLVALLRQHCGTHEACLVRCLSNELQRIHEPDGSVSFIAGGCHHVCQGPSAAGWIPPPGYPDCLALPPDASLGEEPAPEGMEQPPVR